MEKFYDEFYNDSTAQFLNPTNTFSNISLALFPGYCLFISPYKLESMTSWSDISSNV